MWLFFLNVNICYFSANTDMRTVLFNIFFTFFYFFLRTGWIFSPKSQIQGTSILLCFSVNSIKRMKIKINTFWGDFRLNFQNFLCAGSRTSGCRLVAFCLEGGDDWGLKGALSSCTPTDPPCLTVTLLFVVVGLLKVTASQWDPADWMNTDALWPVALEKTQEFLTQPTGFQNLFQIFFYSGFKLKLDPNTRNSLTDWSTDWDWSGLFRDLIGWLLFHKVSCAVETMKLNFGSIFTQKLVKKNTSFS